MSKIILKIKPKCFTFFLVIIGITLLAGCINSNPPPPSVLHSDKFSTVDNSEARTLPNISGVLTVEDAIRIGLENSPTYETARLALKLAYNTLYSSIAGYLPNLILDAKATQADSLSGSYQAGASLMIFDGLQREMTLLSQYQSIKQTDYALKMARLSLVYQIKNTYYQIGQALGKLDVYIADAKFYKMMLDMQRYKKSLNLVTDDYVLNFETNYELAKAKVIEQDLLIKQNRYALAALMGLTSCKLPEGVRTMKLYEIMEEEKISLNTTGGVEYYLDIAISQNPDLKQSRAALKVARYALYSAWGAYSPTVEIGGGSNWTINGWNDFGGGDPQVGFGLNVNWSVWENTRPFDIRGAEINIDIAELAVYSQWIELVKEIRTLYLRAEAKLLQQNIYERAYKSAIRQRKIVQEKYEMGIESITRLNQSQKELVEAEAGNIEAQATVLIARADLERRCGIQTY